MSRLYCSTRKIGKDMRKRMTATIFQSFCKMGKTQLFELHVTLISFFFIYNTFIMTLVATLELNKTL